MRTLLKQKIIDTYISPDGKKQELRDTKDIGLVYEIGGKSTAGNGTYQYRFTINGRQRCLRICRGSEKTLVEVRRLFSDLKAQVANGEDPAEAAKVQKAVITMSEFIEQHYFPYKRQRKKVFKDEDMWRLRLKGRFGQKKLTEVSRKELQDFHTQIREEGLAASTCNHYIKFMRHAFNLAMQWELIDRNPASKIPLFFEDNEIEHYLDDDQLQRLVQLLRTDRCRMTANVFLYLLSTGARLNSALQATWDQIDREHRIWRIPAKNNKSKKVLAVPLNDTALEILDALETEGRHDRLFVSPVTGKPLNHVHKVWNRLRNAAGLPFLRIHDLRHNYASFLVNSGHTLYEVQHILGHSDPTVTQRYAHLSTKTLQTAADSAGAKIASAMR